MPTKALIAFYSRNGSTEALANEIADGARQAGAEVRLRRAREVVGPEVTVHAPGWAENANRMNAATRRRPRPMPSGPMPSCSARRPASARCRPS